MMHGLECRHQTLKPVWRWITLLSRDSNIGMRTVLLYFIAQHFRIQNVLEVVC